MKQTLLALAVVLSAAAVVGRAAPQPARAADSRRLTIEQLIDIRHPSNPIWSPDGKSVVFVWDRAGVSSVYVVAADGGLRQAPHKGIG